MMELTDVHKTRIDGYFRNYEKLEKLSSLVGNSDLISKFYKIHLLCDGTPKCKNKHWHIVTDFPSDVTCKLCLKMI
jgi:hypothetical protein